jgi:hypothetical protein
MQFFTPVLIINAISPVLATGIMSPWANTLVRRTGECYPEPLQFPGPDARPCGGGYTLGNCNCCPDGRTGCLSPIAACSLGPIGNYVCISTTGAGTITPAQCFARHEPCGGLCMPAGSNCCDSIGHYCAASETCLKNADGSNAGVCLKSSTQAATTTFESTIPAATTAFIQTTQATASASGVGISSLPFSSSRTATTQGSISTNAGSSASQVTVSFGTKIQISSWSVGGTFAAIFTVFIF